MSALQKSVLRSRLPPMHPSLPSAGSRAALRRARNYTPTPWSKYFEEKHDVKVSETDVFRVYSSGAQGGVSSDVDRKPVICLLHGGGFSALTWCLFTKHVMELVECEVLAIDLRGHGSTITSDDSDLSADTLARDVGRVLNTFYPDADAPILLMGHSMGGAIAVHVAHLKLLPSLVGVAVIDVVEGTAMDALSSMQSILRGRPSHFKSLERAIEWCIRTGQIRNSESACVSMPGQLKNTETGREAIEDIGKPEEQDASSSQSFDSPLSIQEEPEQGEVFKVPAAADQAAAPAAPAGKYTWRIDLSQTERFWRGWFSGLSGMFLELGVPRMLLLAAVDRLDKELTVGQMQGKFQMQVLTQCGHTVHEDSPDKVAEIVATFLVRHKLAEPKLDFVRTFPCC